MIICRCLRDQFGKAREAKETVEDLNVIFYNIPCLATTKKYERKLLSYLHFISEWFGLLFGCSALPYRDLTHYGTVINVICALLQGRHYSLAR